MLAEISITHVCYILEKGNIEFAHKAIFLNMLKVMKCGIKEKEEIGGINAAKWENHYRECGITQIDG